VGTCVCVAMMLTGVRAGRFGVRIRAETRDLSLLRRDWTGCGPIQSLSAYGVGGGGWGEQAGREAHHSLPCSAEIQNEWSYISASTIRLLGVYRDNFMFL